MGSTMSETKVSQRWMKHREKQGVWHLAVKPGVAGIQLSNAVVTACRGDMLYGTMGPILQLFRWKLITRRIAT